MTNLSRRHHLIGLFLAPAGVGLASVAARALSQATPRTIDITARRFNYSPNQIALKVGEPVVLRFSAIDFTHGFSLPEFNMRADLIEGKQTTIALIPTKAGRFAFLCDNFCGTGHEQMEGVLIVT
jgi:cytochrome c oxidase subunit 2